VSTLGEAGMAYDAKVAFFDIGQTGAGLNTPYDLSEIFEQGYKIGARIHSASWGSDSNAYGYSDVDFDEYMHEHDDFISLVAAGNSGDNSDTCGSSCTSANFNLPGTVGTPATAKNILSVGASQGGPGRLNSGMKGFEYLATFSSRGPTADGRTKPDIIAPGFFIKSASAQTSVGGADETFMAGTSMATPVAAGNAALVRDYFVQGFYPTGSKVSSNSVVPSGALIKAVMISSARPLIGSQNGDNANTVVAISEYDSNQNFGRIQMDRAVPLANHPTMDHKMFIQDTKSIIQSQSEVIELIVDKQNGCSSNDFVLTLVWTDPVAARGCTKCVLNDLDLSVKRSSTGNTIYYPNGRSSRDSTNNAERIRFTSVSHGEKITATIKAQSLSRGSKQKFAFVAVGCIGGKEAEVVVPVTPPPSTAPTDAPTRADTASPTRAPTGSTQPPTTALAREVVVSSSVVLRGCGLYTFTAADAVIIQKTLNKIISAVVEDGHVCDIAVAIPTSSFNEPDPIIDEGPDGRRLSDAVRVDFKISADRSGTSFATDRALSDNMRDSLEDNIENTLMEQWMHYFAGSGLCTNTADIDSAAWVKPSSGAYFVETNARNDLYCSNWQYTRPASNAPTTSPTIAPTRSLTSSPTTASPTKSPTPAPSPAPTSEPTYSPTSQPTSAPTKSPTPVPTPVPTAKPTTAAPTVAFCNDGVKGQQETDVDCGGRDCPKCDLGQSCNGLHFYCKSGMECASPGWTCEYVPTPAPSSAPTVSPTPAPTERVSIVQFVLDFKIEGITWDNFGAKQIAAFVAAVNTLLKPIGGASKGFEVEVRGEYFANYTKCISQCGEDMLASFDGYPSAAMCSAAKGIPQCHIDRQCDVRESASYKVGLRQAMWETCMCSDSILSEPCVSLFNLMENAPAEAGARMLGVWPPEPENNVFAGGCPDGESDIKIWMSDTYGDGWNGALGKITDKASGNQVDNLFTINAGGKPKANGGDGIIPHEMCLPTGGCYLLSISSGSYDSEIGWEIIDYSGSTQISKGSASAGEWGAPILPADAFEFCLGTSAPTEAPTAPPTVAPTSAPTLSPPNLILTLIGQAELDVYSDDYRTTGPVFKEITQKLREMVNGGGLQAALESDIEWGDWQLNTNHFEAPTDYVPGFISWTESDGKPPGIGDEDKKEDGNIMKLLIYIGGGVGALLVVGLLVVVAIKVKGSMRGGGGVPKKHGKNLYGGSAPRAGAAPARRQSKKPSGVNFGAAASKGVKHHGKAPAYGNFQMV